MRNSFVLYSTSADKSSRHAGQIQSIFYHQRREGGTTVTEPFFVVQEFRPLSDAHAAKDPYRQYKQLNTELHYNECLSAIHVLKLDEIISHFAAYIYTPEDIGVECIVVRSLDRVSAHTLRHNTFL